MYSKKPCVVCVKSPKIQNCIAAFVKVQSKLHNKKAQLSLEKKPTVPLTSEAQRRTSNHGEKAISQRWQFHADYVNKMLQLKATINARITHVARGDTLSSRQAI